MKNSIACVCGKIHAVNNSIKKAKLDICSNCHPFYTGKVRVGNTDSRSAKFRKKYASNKSS